MNYKQLLEELLKQYHNGDIKSINVTQSNYRYEISYQDTKNNGGEWMNFSFPTESYLELLTGKGKGELEVVGEVDEDVMEQRPFQVGDQLEFIDKEGYHKKNTWMSYEDLDNMVLVPIEEFDKDDDAWLENGRCIISEEFKFFKVANPKKLITSTEYIESNMSDESKEKIKENTNNLLKQTKLTIDKVYPIPGDILNVVDWEGFEEHLIESDCINTLSQMKYQWSKLVVKKVTDNFTNLDETYADGEVFSTLDKGMMKFFEIIGNELDNSPIFYNGDKIACIDEEGFTRPDNRFYKENIELLKHKEIMVKDNKLAFGELLYITDYDGFRLNDESGLSVSNLTRDELKYFRKLK